MTQITEKVAGLDMHRDKVVACCRVQDPDGSVAATKASFATTTRGWASWQSSWAPSR